MSVISCITDFLKSFIGPEPENPYWDLEPCEQEAQRREDEHIAEKYGGKNPPKE